MSKELEALERLHTSATGYAMVHKRHDKDTLEQALKRNEPMGVKTKVPKIVTVGNPIKKLCPICEKTLYKKHKYCPNCGQRLEWKEYQQR